MKPTVRCAPSSPAATNTAYVANGLNQYTSVGGASSVYDARGNTTTDGGNNRVFTYDLENRLMSANRPTAVTLTYDPTGALATTTASSATTSFLYSGDALIGEYDSSGNVLRRYVPGPGVDEPLVWYEGAAVGNTHWLLSDNQGSIITWSTNTGTGGAIYAYDPYGNPSPAGVWGGSRYRYTGQITIPEAQVYDYKARAYAPQIGRFLQTDPAGFGGGMNLYGYVGNDPVNGWDPSGLAQPANVPTGTTFYCDPQDEACINAALTSTSDSPDIVVSSSKGPIGFAPDFFGLVGPGYNGNSIIDISLRKPFISDRIRRTICELRDWHNSAVSFEVDYLKLSGYNVATNVAIRLASQNSNTFAVTDYIATIPDSNVYLIGEIKTGGATLTKNQAAVYQSGFIQIVGNQGLPIGLEPGDIIDAIWPGVSRYPGCP